MTFNEPMIGDNWPDIAADVSARLALDYGYFTATIAEFEATAAELPETVETKEDHDRMADLVARMRGTFKSVEAARNAEKEPYLKTERVIDGYFNALKVTLSRMADRLSDSVLAYLRRKEDEERRKREEEAKRLRALAEAKRREEEEARRRAEDAARADRRAKHEAKAEAAAMIAGTAEDDADEADKAAAEKPAELARTRSEVGTLSTIKTEWTHTIEDASVIPLDKLRPYLSEDAIEKAIRAFVRFGGRELPGVRIYQTKRAQIR